jgi:hypothetical protein
MWAVAPAPGGVEPKVVKITGCFCGVRRDIAREILRFVPRPRGPRAPEPARGAAEVTRCL